MTNLKRDILSLFHKPLNVKYYVSREMLPSKEIKLSVICNYVGNFHLITFDEPYMGKVIRSIIRDEYSDLPKFKNRRLKFEEIYPDENF